MHFLINYSKTILKRDYIIKFSDKKFPVIKKIILNFNFTKINFNMKLLLINLLFLEVIAYKKAKILKSKKFNVALKIKKGQPVGCIVVLKKNYIYFFLEKLLINNIVLKKNFSKLNKNYFSFSFSDIFKFNLQFFDNNYHFFNTIPKFNVLILINNKNLLELLFVLKSYKIYISIDNSIW